MNEDINDIIEKDPNEMTKQMELQFKEDILNGLLAITVKRLMDFKKGIAVKYLTLDKYDNKKINKIFNISKEDMSSLNNDNFIYNKLRLLCVLEEIVLKLKPEDRTTFAQIKAIQPNENFLRNKIVDISDDYQNLRVIMKLLEKRPIEPIEEK